MPAFIEHFEDLMTISLTMTIHILELMGVVLIIAASFKAFYGTITHKEGTRLLFAQNMATALEFKLAGEILRTVIVRNWEEIAIVGAIIVLRGILNFLINWEIKSEEAKCANLHELKG